MQELRLAGKAVEPRAVESRLKAVQADPSQRKTLTARLSAMISLWRIFLECNRSGSPVGRKKTLDNDFWRI
jgi:hypothetical protein